MEYGAGIGIAFGTLQRFTTSISTPKIVQCKRSFAALPMLVRRFAKSITIAPSLARAIARYLEIRDPLRMKSGCIAAIEPCGHSLNGSVEGVAVRGGTQHKMLIHEGGGKLFGH